jgi:hypothetical protein
MASNMAAPKTDIATMPKYPKTQQFSNYHTDLENSTTIYRI